MKRLAAAIAAATLLAASCGGSGGAPPHHHHVDYKRLAENVVASAGYDHVSCTDELNVLGQRVES